MKTDQHSSPIQNKIALGRNKRIVQGDTRTINFASKRLNTTQNSNSKSKHTYIYYKSNEKKNRGKNQKQKTIKTYFLAIKY